MRSLIVEPCYYCGEPGTTVDHVIPRTLLHQLATLEDERTTRELYARHKIKVVPACRECNNRLASKYFPTLEKRRAYAKERIRKKYKNALETPGWSDSELARLSEDLQGYVLSMLAFKQHILRRLAYTVPAPSALWRELHETKENWVL